MTFKNALPPKKEQELLVEYEDGWTPHELTIIYRVSISTVYRIFRRHGVPTQNNKARRRRRRPVKAPQRALHPCGSNAGYQRHRRAGQYPCTPCLEAHAASVKQAKNGR